MNTPTPQHYWFKRRPYGYGWVPVTYQGWLLIAGYIALIIAITFMAEERPGLVLLLSGILTFGLLRITVATSPKGKWRWGRKPTDNPSEDF